MRILIRFCILCCLFMPLAVYSQGYKNRSASAVPGGTRIEKNDQSQEKKQALHIYENDVYTLADMMGSLYFLQQLCKNQVHTRTAPFIAYRQEMTQFLHVLKASPTLVRQATASFNTAYASLATNYSFCTPSAKIILNMYQEDAARLIRHMLALYGMKAY